MDESSIDAQLELRDIKTLDEGEYKCEITFLDITKDCPVVQLVHLTTLGKASRVTELRQMILQTLMLVGNPPQFNSRK